MTKRIRTPQEKKAFSLAKDRRNAYGERGANSRFAIARHKTKDLRRNRRRENAPLQQIAQDPSGDGLAHAQLKVATQLPPRWRKSPDSPLQVVVLNKNARRAAVLTPGGGGKSRDGSK